MNEELRTIELRTIELLDSYFECSIVLQSKAS